jgi:hypothetical protein
MHMFVLVSVTAACGLLSSYVLLKAGVTTMAVRYPAAAALAYLAFLGLVSLWLRRFRLRARDESSANWGLDLEVPEIPLGGSHSGSAGDGGWSLDLDEGALWLVPVAIIGAIAFGVLIYIVYLAPALFAELLLDAGLAAGLYRRLARVERRAWLMTAVRNTIIPAGFVAVLLALAGVIMQGVYPDATSIGVVVRHLEHDTDAR